MIVDIPAPDGGVFIRAIRQKISQIVFDYN